MENVTLTGNRVLLRGFRLSDAAAVRELAGNRAVADNRLSIPYPFDERMAEQRISDFASRMDRGEVVSFAIAAEAGDRLVGEVSLRIDQESRQAVLSYWIGKPYWGLGYCTEAASIAVGFGFESLNLSRISARCLPTNTASLRVLQKLGMRPEGQSRRYNTKLGKYEDLVQFAMKREAWLSAR